MTPSATGLRPRWLGTLLYPAGLVTLFLGLQLLLGLLEVPAPQRAAVAALPTVAALLLSLPLRLRRAWGSSEPWRTLGVRTTAPALARSLLRGVLKALLLLALVSAGLALAGQLSWQPRLSPALALNALLLGLGVGFAEELLFRGWLLAALRGAGGRRRCVTAVVIQAAIFAAFHLLPERMPQTFLLGLVAGWMTVISGSLWPAIIAHLAHNAVPVVLLLAAGDADVTAIEETARLPPAVIAAGVASLLGGIVLVAVGRGTTIPPPSETTP